MALDDYQNDDDIWNGFRASIDGPSPSTYGGSTPPYGPSGSGYGGPPYGPSGSGYGRPPYGASSPSLSTSGYNSYNSYDSGSYSPGLSSWVGTPPSTYGSPAKNYTFRDDAHGLQGGYRGAYDTPIYGSGSSTGAYYGGSGYSAGPNDDPTIKAGYDRLARTSLYQPDDNDLLSRDAHSADYAAYKQPKSTTGRRPGLSPQVNQTSKSPVGYSAPKQQRHYANLDDFAANMATGVDPTSFIPSAARSWTADGLTYVKFPGDHRLAGRSPKGRWIIPQGGDVPYSDLFKDEIRFDGYKPTNRLLKQRNGYNYTVVNFNDGTSAMYGPDGKRLNVDYKKSDLYNDARGHGGYDPRDRITKPLVWWTQVPSSDSDVHFDQIPHYEQLAKRGGSFYTVVKFGDGFVARYGPDGKRFDFDHSKMVHRDEYDPKLGPMIYDPDVMAYVQERDPIYTRTIPTLPRSAYADMMSGMSDPELYGYILNGMGQGTGDLISEPFEKTPLKKPAKFVGGVAKAGTNLLTGIPALASTEVAAFDPGTPVGMYAGQDQGDIPYRMVKPIGDSIKGTGDLLNQAASGDPDAAGQLTGYALFPKVFEIPELPGSASEVPDYLNSPVEFTPKKYINGFAKNPGKSSGSPKPSKPPVSSPPSTNHIPIAPKAPEESGAFDMWHDSRWGYRTVDPFEENWGFNAKPREPKSASPEVPRFDWNRDFWGESIFDSKPNALTPTKGLEPQVDSPLDGDEWDIDEHDESKSGNGPISSGTKPTLAGAIASATKKISKRLQYLGSTPGKNSRTGREVLHRMIGEGKVQADENNNLLIYHEATDMWHPYELTDMGHIFDAVHWWNSIGKYFGPKSAEVRAWMLDPSNYVLEPRSWNRSNGAKLRVKYDEP